MSNVSPPRPVLIATLFFLAFATRPAAAQSLYWTDSDASRIWRANADGTGAQLLVDASDGLIEPRGITVDYAGGKMYWAENGTDRIRRANLHGNDIETIVATDLGFPADLALDAAAGKLYWADRQRDWIRRANLDGSGVETIVNLPAPGDNAAPYFLALDLRQSKLYWTDFNSATIHRANLDGSQQQNFLTVPAPARLRDVALDLDHNHIYWTDRGSAPKIQRANLDGTGIVTLFNAADGLLQPHGLALDVGNGWMYWSDPDLGDLFRGRIDGNGAPQLLASGTPGINGPWGVAIPEPSALHLAAIALGVVAAPFLRRWRRGVMGLVLFLAAANSASLSSAADSSARLVAISGQTAPGTAHTFQPLNPDYHHSPFFDVAMNNAGRVALRGFLDNGESGIWSEGRTGALELIALAGQPPVAGPDNFSFVFFSGPNISAHGDTTFLGYFNPPNTNPTLSNHSGLWIAPRDGPTRLVVRNGEATPQSEGRVFGGSIWSYRLSDQGRPAFTLRDDTDDLPQHAVMVESADGALHLLAQFGTSGETYSGAGISGVNRHGQVAYSLLVDDDTMSHTNVYAQTHWLGAIGQPPQTIAVPGQDVAGTTNVLRGASSTSINRHGQTAHQALIGFDQSVVRGDGAGNLELVALSSQTAPDQGVAAFGRFYTPVIDPAGNIAFLTTHREPNGDSAGSAIWIASANGTLSLVAREGDPAPGLGPVAVFGYPDQPMINASNWLAFYAIVRNADNPAAPETDFMRGVWLRNPSGNLEKLVAEGDWVRLGPDDRRQIRHLAQPYGSASNTESGQPVEFNDLAQLLVRAIFTDGSEGLFVTEPQWTPQVGDLDLDGHVGATDAATLIANFGRANGAGWTNGDLDGDGTVALADLALLASQMSSPPATTAAPVPEPSSILLMLSTALLGVWLSRSLRGG